jgi:hypothetical protein
VEAEVFGSGITTTSEREEAERVLAEAAERWPAG